MLEPTKIYVKSCLAAIRSHAGVKALSHITGGGLLENIPRVLPEGFGAELRRSAWEIPAIFQWLQEAGNIEDKELYRTFNCGVGMVLVVEASTADAIIQLLTLEGEKVYTLGEITRTSDAHRVKVI